MKHVEGHCVGCGEVTTSTIECNCTQAIFACAACCDSGASLRCATCRERQRRAVYACRDYREDPEPGRDMGGCLSAVAPVGAWGPPYRAV